MNINSSPSVTLVVTYSVSFCLLSVHNNMKRYKQVNQLKKNHFRQRFTKMSKSAKRQIRSGCSEIRLVRPVPPNYSILVENCFKGNELVTKKGVNKLESI